MKKIRDFGEISPETGEKREMVMQNYDAYEVDKLIKGLDPNRSYTDRRNAALALGELETSSLVVVSRLLETKNTDPNFQIQQLAEAALDSSAHQTILAENPELVELGEGTDASVVGQKVEPFSTPDAIQTNEQAEAIEYVCQKCSRSDETLAVVQYPYAVSLIFITFRRNFSGLWCGKHQMQYRTLAGLITSIFGWLGIPYGFLFTPVYLFKLAQGGEVFTGATTKMLSELAEQKLQQGDREGAIRCLEQQLKYGDHEEARATLNRLRPQLFTQKIVVRARDKLFRTLTVLFAAAAIGSLIGTLDFVTTLLLSPVLDMSGSIFILIISWAPLVGWIFIGGIALFKVIEWGLIKAKYQQRISPILVGVIASLFTIYGLLQATSVFWTVWSLNTPGLFEDNVEKIAYMILTLLVGGPFMILDMVEVGTTVDIIYLAIILVTTGYFLFFSVRTAIETTKWQKRLDKDYDPGPGSA